MHPDPSAPPGRARQGERTQALLRASLFYRRVRVSALAIAFLFIAGTLPAGSDPSWSRRVLILARALAYDRHLTERAGEEIAVAVLYRESDPASRAAADEILPYFKAVEKVRLLGLPFRAIAIAYDNPEDLSDAMANDGIDAVYVCPGMDQSLIDLIKVTRGRKVVSMTSQEAFVKEGLSLGIIVEDAEPKLVLNLAASRAEGCDFSAQLLRLARVIR
jgi:hypothetical protein